VTAVQAVHVACACLQHVVVMLNAGAAGGVGPTAQRREHYLAVVYV